MLLQRKNDSRDASSRSLMRWGARRRLAGSISGAKQELRIHQHEGASAVSMPESKFPLLLRPRW